MYIALENRHCWNLKLTVTIEYLDCNIKEKLYYSNLYPLEVSRYK